MVSLGVSSPSRKSPPCPYALSSNHFKSQGPPLSSIFHQSHKKVESVKNSNKLHLSRAEEKHVDTYMVMSTTKNKTRTKYSKKVSEK